MDSFEGKLAVVTGGGAGMGRELVIQLAAAGAEVATCDMNPETVAESARLAEAAGWPGTRVTTHLCDVSDEAQVEQFRDELLSQHHTSHVNLLFNNAGIGGGGSFVSGSRSEWDRTFAITWGGVYHCTRVMLPLLVASDAGCIINTSSVNGFWAALGPGVPHTAYSTAKFAVKGFTEALQEDLRVNAPHVRAILVMPGHVGTDIVLNSYRAHGGSTGDMAAAFSAAGVDDHGHVDTMVELMGASFRDNAPMSAKSAATIMLDAVRTGAWRVLVGDDALALDKAVRAAPESVYGPGGLGSDGVRTG
jgi:NAD(P)-dependent dehydrogenase (short-subunit alcohol dehydrogenase family)